MNETVDTTPGNELNLIRTTQRTNETRLLIGIIEGRIPLTARNLTPRIMKTG